MYMLGCLMMPINQNHTIVLQEQGEAMTADQSSHSHYWEICLKWIKSAGFSEGAINMSFVC